MTLGLGIDGRDDGFFLPFFTVDTLLAPVPFVRLWTAPETEEVFRCCVRNEPDENVESAEVVGCLAEAGKFAILAGRFLVLDFDVLEPFTEKSIEGP